MDEVAKELGGLQILVNNGGIGTDGLILRYKAEYLRRVLDVDLASAFHLSKAAVRPMMKQRGGSIVNMTSVVGEQGNAAQTAYAAAKAGLKKAMIEGAALGRTGTPREVAEAIAFLASDRSSFVTVEVLRVNGGLYI